ncbi:MAG: helix-turn-helix domain-containing protein [Akkermansiaceae bacterium]
MQAHRKQNKTTTITPRWLTLDQGETYAGVSKETLRNWSRAGHLTLHRVAPMGTRGRTLIDRNELDALIESYAAAPACKLAMNTRKEGA